jgi:plasmid stability protein
MPAVLVRNLPEATHRALKSRAKQHGRSTEAEIRSILQGAVRTDRGVGAALASIGRALGGLDLPVERDRRPVESATFE